MTPMYRISQIYDIAAAFITDSKSVMSVTQNKYFVSYQFTRTVPHVDNFTLKIIQPIGNVIKPEFGVRDWEVDYKLGTITLTDSAGYLLMSQTRHSVGKVGYEESSKLQKTFARAKSHKFFKLVDMANKRNNGNMELKDNTAEIFGIVAKLRCMQR